MRLLLICALLFPVAAQEIPSEDKNFCMTMVAAIVEKQPQFTRQAMLSDFVSWLHRTPPERRNRCYKTWCTYATQDAIWNAYAEDGVTSVSGETGWFSGEVERCLDFSRGGVV